MTHAVDMIEKADRVMVIEQGKVTAFGNQKEIKENQYIKDLFIAHEKQITA